MSSVGRKTSEDVSRAGDANTTRRRQSKDAVQSLIDEMQTEFEREQQALASTTGRKVSPPVESPPQPPIARRSSHHVREGQPPPHPPPPPPTTLIPFPTTKTVVAKPTAKGQMTSLPPIPGVTHVSPVNESESSDEDGVMKRRRSHVTSGARREPHPTARAEASASRPPVGRVARSKSHSDAVGARMSSTFSAQTNFSQGTALSERPPSGAQPEAEKPPISVAQEPGAPFRRLDRTRSFGGHVGRLTDDEVAKAAAEALRRRTERKEPTPRSTALHAPPFQPATAPGRAHWVGSDLSSHSASSHPTTPSHLGGSGTELPDVLAASTGSGSLRLPRSIAQPPAAPAPGSAVPSSQVRQVDRAELSQKRKLEEVQRRTMDVEERDRRHNPEHVRAKRWAEAIALSVFTGNVIREGLHLKAEQERLAWARRVLAHLFVPLWRCYSAQLKQSAQHAITRFILGVAARRRLKRRNKSVDIIKSFLHKKLTYFPLVIRWYQVVVKRVQRVVRRFLQRREAQVRLNLLKTRRYEATTYWQDAKMKRERLQVKHRTSNRPGPKATSAARDSAFTTSVDEPPSPAPIERQVPETILKRQIRILISKKARAWHREEIRRDSVRRGMLSGSAGAGSSFTAGPPKPSPKPPRTPDSVDERFLSSENSSRLEHRSSSMRAEMDLLRHRNGSYFNHVFGDRECRHVLDEAARTTAEIQKDPAWKAHLITIESGSPGIALDASASGSPKGDASPLADAYFGTTIL